VSISVVNGYLCTSSCDAAKARTGQDPHPRSTADQTPKPASDPTRSPAVVFGGALADRNAVGPVGTGSAAGASGNNPSAAGLDIRV
jgi:hypothetical protein